MQIFFLLARFDMLVILGKRDKRVPVILTPDVKKAMETLNQARVKGNVALQNPHVFAVNDGKSENSLRGNDVIRNVCKKVDYLGNANKNPIVLQLLYS